MSCNDWLSAISAPHSGITEEDLRAAGVTNPSHRRRILENLPRNWNWHTDTEKCSWYEELELDPRSERRTDWSADQSNLQDFAPALPPFHLPINAVTIPVSVSTQQMEHDAGSDRRRLCFTHLSILRDNEENGRPPVCPLTDACTNIDLSIKVSLILLRWIFNDYKNIVLHFPVFTWGKCLPFTFIPPYCVLSITEPASEHVKALY